MSTNPDASLFTEMLEGLLSPQGRAALDAAAVAYGTERLDGLIDAVASDITRSEAPLDRNTQIVDVAVHLGEHMQKETLAVMATIAIFRSVESGAEK